MNQENDESIQQKKNLDAAIGHPHLLVSAQKIVLKSGKTVENICTITHKPEELLHALVYHSNEAGLQRLISFFSKALEKHRKFESGVKGRELWE
jgi:hypothetical protein